MNNFKKYRNKETNEIIRAFETSDYFRIIRPENPYKIGVYPEGAIIINGKRFRTIPVNKHEFNQQYEELKNDK